MDKGLKKKILITATKLFFSLGYEKSSIRKIEKESGINYGSIMHALGYKENLVCEIVTYILDKQAKVIEEEIDSKTSDPVKKYITEKVLQLYMAECNEELREMYNVAYSMERSSNIIHITLTKKLEKVFKEKLPNYDTIDFYCLELSSAGIVRSYLARKCDMFFTMKVKVDKFIENFLKMYDYNDKEIKEIKEFVYLFDLKGLAKNTVSKMPAYIEKRISEEK
ncbi:MAG: TetR/AcrR family transcriptional regulator [Bacilli bacterium]|nr:TetR/AcrR family transcriptional regulator [Bacilli bacterium]